MSAELLGLLQACRENPDDDTPRLILADWLVDHDDPDRAEFIRLQIQGAHMPQQGHARRGPRERLLLARNRSRWLGPLQQAPDEKLFERGLIRVNCRLSAWLDFAQTVSSWAGWEWVQSLQISRSPARQTRLHAPLRLPPQLTSLTLATGLGAAGGKILAESADLERLLVLELSYTQLGPKGAGFLADSSNLTRLTHLDLIGNQIGSAGLQALAGSEHLAGLKSLDLRWNNLEPAGLRCLAESPTLSRLSSLTLACNSVELAGVEALAGSAQLARLTVLDLAQSGLGPEAVATLLAAPHLSQLSALDLSQNSFGDAGVQAIVRGLRLENLKELRLQGCQIGATGVRMLAEFPRLADLSLLDLRLNAIDAKGAAALARSTTLSRRLQLLLSKEELHESAVEPLRARYEMYCE
jgi:uncharacterized protein (TIGR02996 family)